MGTDIVKIERFTTEQVIEAIQATKGMVTLAARHLQCHPQTIRNYIERHPTVAQAFKEQREGFLDLAELKLISAVQNGELPAILFALRTIGKSRGYIERIQVENDPINWAQVDDETLAQYRAGKLSEADVRRSYAGKE